MRIAQHKMVLVAVFVFAAGFVSSATAFSDIRCQTCMSWYEACIAEGAVSGDECILRHNACVEGTGCPPMPI